MSTRFARRIPAVMLASTLAALAAFAHASPSEGGDEPVPTTVDSLVSRTPDARIRSLPHTGPVQRVFSRSGRSSVNMLLRVTFDARGRVTEATVLEGSIDPAADAVITRWALGIVVETSEAGTGRLPMVFRFDDMPADALSAEPLPPMPEAILDVARAAGLDYLAGNVVLHYRGGEVWDASLSEGTGDAATDAAILAWARAIPPLRHDGVVSTPLSQYVWPVVPVQKQKGP